MSGITFINRVTGATNNIVYLETADSTATATASNYLTAQAAKIASLNDGAWTWETNDCIMLSASDGISWCSINTTFTTLTTFSGSGTGGATFTAPSVANHLAVFTNTTGNLSQDVATAINQGNIQAGLSGHAGTLISFPGTAANGSLILAAVNAGGAFNTTISNGPMAQSTVYSLGDIGAATGGIPVSTAPFLMKQVAQAAVAGGAAAQTVTDAFCTSASNVIAVWNDTTNAVQIEKVAAGNGSFVVTSTADPGASHLNYVIMK